MVLACPVIHQSHFAHRIKESDTFLESLPNDVFVDDKNLNHTKRYTLAVQILRLFANLLVKTIESWDAFAAEQLSVFHTGRA